MREKIKKNIINIFAFTLGIVLSTIIVSATTYISGGNVGYSNSKLSSDNIQDAIDELYTLSKTKTKIKAWEYHETGNNRCINGEEDTCVSTTCYKTSSTCEAGTVIKYYVNDNLYRYFYVLRDDGEKITMQQRENTIRNIEWVTKEDYISSGGTGEDYGTNGKNNKGPITVLNALEETTSTWTNVDVLEYTLGTDTLYENAYTGCTWSATTYLTSCGENKYTMSTRKARARMITVLEASATGCLVSRNDNINNNNYGSCPDYMHNYLYDSENQNYGGSYSNDTTNEKNVYDSGYWTLSANSGGSTSALAWYVHRYGLLGANYISYTNYGARAVVEITKSNL